MREKGRGGRNTIKSLEDMNREIKFRGRNNWEWYFGSLVLTDDNRNEPFRRTQIKKKLQICFYHAGDWGMGGWQSIVVDPETVGQFTGLKDKNGKKIYEGDIIQFGSQMESKNVVKYIGRNAGFLVKDKFGDWQWLYDVVASTSTEVIGNIHDTPDLIK
ncbi:hypothetical protein EZS27_009365 [termite gut metagenome]|uniref:YopX protein domain-containing protein n=1 Tax=termite gut metagenome TaxID=433724 RepID=A0A5J4SBS4_9ZZZZ